MEKHFLLWVEQIILPKNIILAQFAQFIVQIFTIIQFFKYFLSTNWENTLFVRSAPVDIPSKIQLFQKFCKVRACRYSFKNSIFKKLPKIVENHFLWWVKQIILPNNIFLAQIEIIQIFTIFVRSAPVDFLLKNQFSKNCLNCGETLSLMSGTNIFAK